MSTHRTLPSPPVVPGWNRGLTLVLAAALCAAGGARLAAAHGDGSYPRTFNLDMRNQIDAVRDSRYDVLAHSSRVLNPQLDSLRMLNPSIRRLVHTSFYVYYYNGPSGYASEWGPFPASDPSLGFERKYWDLLQNNNWWLWAVDSSGTRYHAAMAFNQWSANFSTKCPKNAQGKRLCDVFADFLADELVAQRHVEGVFFDYCNGAFSWMNWYMWGSCPDDQNCTIPGLPTTPGTKFKSAFDCDGNYLPDPNDSLDTWWRQGVSIVMDRLRQRMGPNFIVVGNGTHHYTAMNGAMIERFPMILGSYDPSPNPYGYKWNSNMFSSLCGYIGSYEEIFAQPRVNLIDVVTPALNTFEPDRTADRERFKRYTLGSTLMADGYHGVRGWNYSYTWWEPEWDLRLGWPLGEAADYTAPNGLRLMVRHFQNGEAWVNPNGYAVAAGAGGNPAIGAFDAVITQTTPLDAGAPAAAGPRLEAAWPNPAVAGSAVRFTVEPGIPATLQIYDVRGRLVREVWSGVGTGLPQVATWEGDSDFGTDAPAGIYFASLFSNGRKLEQRLVRIR